MAEYSHQKILLDRSRRWLTLVAELLWAWVDSWEVWQKYLYRGCTCVSILSKYSCCFWRGSVSRANITGESYKASYTWASKFPKLTSMFHFQVSHKVQPRFEREWESIPPRNRKNINIWLIFFNHLWSTTRFLKVSFSACHSTYGSTYSMLKSRKWNHNLGPRWSTYRKIKTFSYYVKWNRTFCICWYLRTQKCSLSWKILPYMVCACVFVASVVSDSVRPYGL